MKSKKKKIIIEKIYEPIYRLDLAFIAGCSWNEAKKELLEWVKPELTLDMSENTGVCIRFSEKDFPGHVKGKVWFIWIKSKRDYYTLIHETAHLVTEIFVDKGMEINLATTEAFAFYQEFWCRKLWKIMSK